MDPAPINLQQKHVLSIQSSVVHGYVGNKAAVFPLQLHGYDVDPINSVQFSNHTGYKHFTGEKMSGEHIVAIVQGLKKNQLLSYSHLLTGYIGNVEFLKTVVGVARELRASNPDLVYVCDPVMGDGGKLYVPPEFVPIYRDQLVQLATVLTPNQTEAQFLTGVEISDASSALSACRILHSKGVRTVVITSLELQSDSKQPDDEVCILASDSETGDAWLLSTPRIGSYYSGCGDLTAALLLTWMDRHPGQLKTALEKTIATVHRVIERTAAAGTKELRLIQSRDVLECPTVDFQAVPFTAPPSDSSC